MQNLLTHTLNMQPKLHFSQTLNELSGTEQTAVTGGETISELLCSPVKVQLKRSLIHGKNFATKPLF